MTFFCALQFNESIAVIHHDIHVGFSDRVLRIIEIKHGHVIYDADGYRREAEAARRLGYLGKSAIHPTQVPIANEVFRPTDDEIAHSLKVVEAARVAAEKGVGAFTVNGRMVDAPFVRRAEAILDLARRLKLLAPEERTIQ